MNSRKYSMLRKLLYLTLVGALILLPPVPAPRFLNCGTSAATAENSMDLASTDAGQDIGISADCGEVLARAGGTLNVELFRAQVDFLASHGGPTPEYLKSSLSSPEKLLAAIEYVSRTQKYEGFGFPELLKSLDGKELKKLYKHLSRATKSGGITEGDMEDLVVDIYRISHRPRGFWRLAYDTKSLREAFDKLDDQVIRERFEMSLFHEGMQKAFGSIIVDGNLRQRFAALLKEHRNWIDTSVAVAVWTGTVVLVHVTGVPDTGWMQTLVSWAPSYLPSFEKFRALEFPEKALETARKKGLESGIALAGDGPKNALKKARIQKFVRYTYMFAFMAVLSATLYPQFAAQFQQASGAVAANQFNQDNSLLNKYLAFGKLTPEQQGIEDFNRFVRFLRQHGYKVDVNSKEMQAEKQRRIEIYVERARQLAAAQKKDPNPQ